MNKEDLFGKVIYLKNRVWTIYGITDNQGVFCYQGIKPYESFQFDSRTNETRNTTYFRMEDIQEAFIEGAEIEWYMKKMQSADKKKLTKQHAVDFYVHLTGHSKAFVSKNIKVEERAVSDSFLFMAGAVRYDLWKTDGALLLSHNIHGVTHHAYFDYLTFDSHSRLNDKQEDAIRQEIIDNYKEYNE